MQGRPVPHAPSPHRESRQHGAPTGLPYVGWALPQESWMADLGCVPVPPPGSVSIRFLFEQRPLTVRPAPHCGVSVVDVPFRFVLRAPNLAAHSTH